MEVSLILTPAAVDWKLPRAGVGLRAPHYRTILASLPDIGFFEVHAENYMAAGGAHHRYLTAICEHYPLSLHGVGLSLGSDLALSRGHLRRLRALIERYGPSLVSEHLAWSTGEYGFLNDLLPLPYTEESLDLVIEHVDQAQEALQTRILIENPSVYLRFVESALSETEFMAEVIDRTGCGLLLDLNNVYVSSVNLAQNPFSYIDSAPLGAVGEIHLAGHASEEDDKGRPLLIDTHNRQVDDAVWQLYAYTLCRTGPVPTLIEWDADIPSWPVLHAEAARANRMIDTARGNSLDTAAAGRAHAIHRSNEEERT